MASFSRLPANIFDRSDETIVGVAEAGTVLHDDQAITVREDDQKEERAG
jgi:hypothetical protein